MKSNKKNSISKGKDQGQDGVLCTKGKAVAYRRDALTRSSVAPLLIQMYVNEAIHVGKKRMIYTCTHGSLYAVQQKFLYLLHGVRFHVASQKERIFSATAPGYFRITKMRNGFRPLCRSIAAAAATAIIYNDMFGGTKLTSTVTWVFACKELYLHHRI